MSEPTQLARLSNKIDHEVLNFVRLQQDLAERRLVWESRPTFLEFSFNTACNLRCVMCHQSENPPVVKAPDGRGEALLAWFGEHGTVWTPSATSEPLANDPEKLLAHCEAHHLFLELITNVMLLKPAVVEKLMPRIQRLTLSIDSHEREVLERVRRPVKFDVLVEHARYALARCNEANVATNVHIVLMMDNVRVLGDYIDWVADLGAREVTLLDMLDNTPRAAEMSVWRNLPAEEVHACVRAMIERAHARKLNLTLEIPAPLGGRYAHHPNIPRAHSAAVMEKLHDVNARAHAGFCPMVSNYLKVEPDGTAYPCCRAPRELVLGNVWKDGIDAVWNGAPMQELRRRMFSGDLPTPCVGCYVVEAPKWDAAARGFEKSGPKPTP
jgi:radical SAM protein with 4Fe4S-binding SPASM domain